MPAAKELIAHNRSEEEVCAAIGADKMIYQDLEDLIEAVGRGNREITHFDTSCFSKIYITGDVDDVYLEQTELLRNDGVKAKPRGNLDFVAEM